MTVVPDNLCKLNYPIRTPEAEAMWASRHKCNRMKSIIAYSLNLVNANDNLRRYGYTLQWRKKAIRAFGKYVNQPDMKDIPLSPISTPWWECMPVGKPEEDTLELKLWEDFDLWNDDEDWIELIIKIDKSKILGDGLLKEEFM